MSFWLIERHINDRLHYWSAGATGRGSRDGWSTDWSFATKLADQESAHQVLFRLLDGEGRVAEHGLVAG
jgi:hypothetical protein